MATVTLRRAGSQAGRLTRSGARARLLDLARRSAYVLLLSTLTTLCAVVVSSFAQGLSLVIRGAGAGGILRSMAELTAVDSTERMLTIPVGERSIRARLYAPVGRVRHTVLLTPGAQPGGIDDARLTRVARELSRSGIAVLTPDFPELTALVLPPRLTDDIEQTALWLARESGLSLDARIGMMGASFSAGLTMVAAGRPALRPHVRYVFAFGGHDDLPRVLQYLATGAESPSTEGSDASFRRPHEYGVSVLLLGLGDRLVPEQQVPSLEDAVTRFLRALYLERQDAARSNAQVAELRELARTLPEPSSTIVTELIDRKVDRLGARLLPHIGAYGEEAALSPARSPLPTGPVFLLHGAGDPLIPASESEKLAARLRGRSPVRLLLTDTISHAEVGGRATVLDVMRLAGFWADILDER
jgi:dienelactone hydrolase